MFLEQQAVLGPFGDVLVGVLFPGLWGSKVLPHLCESENKTKQRTAQHPREEGALQANHSLP